MFVDPVKILQSFGLGDSMIVADLGAGSGFYSIAAAKMVPNGKVYVVEVQKDYLTTVKTKAETDHLKNLEYFWGDIEKIGGTKIGDRITDVVIISNVLFMAENKKKLLEEAKRILKYEGRVLFIDWSDTSSALGPRAGSVINPVQAKEMFTTAGFTYEKDIPAGEHHYGIIFRKK
ncbi:MAG: methyltransferase domain-containing protein [Candidatus Nomurabacteria bacterium]|nr:methyltransferase domain-containing protein [Candidatus Nomurabacteria bacterium]